MAEMVELTTYPTKNAEIDLNNSNPPPYTLKLVTLPTPQQPARDPPIPTPQTLSFEEKCRAEFRKSLHDLKFLGIVRITLACLLGIAMIGYYYAFFITVYLQVYPSFLYLCVLFPAASYQLTFSQKHLPNMLIIGNNLTIAAFVFGVIALGTNIYTCVAWQDDHDDAGIILWATAITLTVLGGVELICCCLTMYHQSYMRRTLLPNQRTAPCKGCCVCVCC